ncbi:MAG: hypothetical protein ABIE94_05335 [archaeon]
MDKTKSSVILAPNCIEDFFDGNSGDVWYLAGFSWSAYSSERERNNGGDYRNCWNSTKSGLITKVRKKLETDAAIQHPPGSEQFRLQIRNDHLQESLVRKGCLLDRTERTFPEGLDKRRARHFIRGFLEDRLIFFDKLSETGQYYINDLRVRFNPDFLEELYDALIEYTGVNRGKGVKYGPTPQLWFGHEDSIRIHDFLYTIDWDYTKKHDLWLPSVKRRFEYTEI